MSSANTTGSKNSPSGGSTAFRYWCPECLTYWYGNGSETHVDNSDRAVCKSCLRERSTPSATTTDTALAFRQRVKKQ